jgi:hypothetical protein
MPTIKLDLDTKTYRRLTKVAIHERRPIQWQAEVLLLQALGLPAPTPIAALVHEVAPAPEEPEPQEVP